MNAFRVNTKRKQEHKMNSQQLNARKKEILDAQELMLKRASTNHMQMTATENARFDNFTKELDDINVKLGLGKPRETSTFTDATKSKFTMLGSKKPLNVDSTYHDGFWASMRSPESFNKFQIQNAALGEGGTAADGSYLVPIETSPEIPALAMVECSMRQLAKVLTTQMNINIPYQSAKSTAAVKAESNNSGTNAFGTSVPQFATTLLSAFMIGNSVTVSTELFDDVKIAEQFIVAELQRAIRTEEEYLFWNGSGSGQPQGALGNFTTATGASITDGGAALGINPILDTVGSLNRAYYGNAKWAVNRQEALRLYKAQVANGQYQTYFSFDPDGAWRLLGFPMEFSAEIPAYVASPETNGVWCFGDFSAGYVIGDRQSSAIRVKVLSEINALNGQVTILGSRRTDGRVVLQEAVVELQTTS
jgi:HK97 family phage major capsid protein